MAVKLQGAVNGAVKGIAESGSGTHSRGRPDTKRTGQSEDHPVAARSTLLLLRRTQHYVSDRLPEPRTGVLDERAGFPALLVTQSNCGSCFGRPASQTSGWRSLADHGAGHWKDLVFE